MKPSYSKEGAIAFLSSSFIPGIGKKTAENILNFLGDNAMEVLLSDVSIIESVPQLTKKQKQSITDVLSSSKLPIDLLLKLFSSGLSETDIEKIYSHYGSLTEKVIEYDPYEMVEDVWKFSFFSADKIGQYNGISSEDPRRLRGAVLTSIKMHAEDGHTNASREQTIKAASRITGASESLFDKEIDNLIQDGRIISSHEGLYLPVYYKAEKEAARKLGDIINNHSGENPIELKGPLKDIKGNPFTKEQEKAILTVLNHPVTIITGGPGTGKTTAIKGLIELIKEQGKSLIMVAPTGRAAKRLSDLTGEEAKTIHRLLGYRPGEGYKNKKLDTDFLIIDEASMLEQVLFNHLLQALRPGTKIVLIGDTNQLPPIGAGDVLRDMIISGTIPLIVLTANFRQKEGSLIALNAKSIIGGKLPLSDETKDFIVIEENTPKRILKRILDVVSCELPEKFGIDPKEIQIVSPQKEGSLGSRELNILVQERVNPNEPEIKKGLKRFRKGDRVMQTSNSSKRNIFNGETGWVSEIFEDERCVEVTFFDGKKSVYEYKELGELSLAYAVTVHKLQGSETDYMVMVLSSGHRQLLYRNLLYTAVSRAKKLCVIIGEKKALEQAVENNIATRRNSNFKWRLRKYILNSES